MRLADVIGRVLGKVEVALAGADADLREGEDALIGGDALAARAAARRVLARAPNSPLGLALLADACDAAHLDAELAMVLEDLARRVPSRAEVWVRLGRARRATGAAEQEVREAFVRALSVAEPGSDERADSLLALADVDLERGDGARAELWLDRLAPTPATSHDVSIRRAEARLLLNDAPSALRMLDALEWPPTDGRAALARGRALALVEDRRATSVLLRAMILGARGASEALSSALSRLPTDAVQRAQVALVVEAAGERELPRWRAAFADAIGERGVARQALVSALRDGGSNAALPLLESAVKDRDASALSLALRSMPPDSSQTLVLDARRLEEALSAKTTRPTEALDGIELVGDRRAVGWAEDLCGAIARRWVPPSRGSVDYSSLLARLSSRARAQSDLESVAAISDIAAQRNRPVRLAVVGEFNAGKSTFINALIGADVAPTGVLPTTASIHHLEWAPDPFARVKFTRGQSPPERVVALPGLREALRALDVASIERVEILMPLEFLRHIEVIDTPGFNSQDPRHAEVARAAFDEADIALWLIDATQAAKNSERHVLEEACRTGLPVQILINKADRVSQADLCGVMAFVLDAFRSAGMSSWAPPLFLSAKRALAGRMGDETALRESGWGAVQSLLGEQIASRGDELKDLALRRRARRVVGALLRRATADDECWRREAQAHVERRQAIGLEGADLERDPDAAISRLTQALTDPALALRLDLSQVLIGRDKSSSSEDPSMRRYVMARTLEALSNPLATALSSLSGRANLSASELLPVSRALIRGAIASTTPQTPEIEVEALARAAVATLVEQLFALSSTQPAGSPSGGIVRELKAFDTALS